MKSRILIGLLVLIVLFNTGEAALSEWTTPVIGTATGSGSLSVAEDQALSTTIHTLAATGAATITYSLLSTGTPFAVAGTGELTITSALDYETTTSYVIEVEAVDDDPTTGTATITVSVTDVNEPTFGSSSYSPCILDGSVADTTLTTVLATDADTGDTVTHAIAGGNTNTDFKIAAATGVIQVNTGKTLAKATNPSYNLVIEADDGSHTSTTTVTVTVADSCNGVAAVGFSMLAILMAFLVAKI
ncbi:protocadherin-11 X-linked-like [Mercenaria mercenaria]|uniref:protocadherin-11 X-linked-like n=1 Tax=Mercenaria mercenaria TaxID=6596 RepID=UPI00234F4FDF|nr:protocadherin-11 X-linked-like [Mercenaria mercenaria]